MVRGNQWERGRGQRDEVPGHAKIAGMHSRTKGGNFRVEKKNENGNRGNSAMPSKRGPWFGGKGHWQHAGELKIH